MTNNSEKSLHAPWLQSLPTTAKLLSEARFSSNTAMALPSGSTQMRGNLVWLTVAEDNVCIGSKVPAAVRRVAYTAVGPLGNAGRQTMKALPEASNAADGSARPLVESNGVDCQQIFSALCAGTASIRPEWTTKRRR
jgi:hypothetical protein